MSKTPIQDSIRAYALAQVGGPYIMGATAVECTPKYRKARAAQYPEYADKMCANCKVLSGKQSGCEGCKWEGRIAHDCAQLTKFAAKSGGITLPSGATSQWTKVDWFRQGEIADMPMDVVCFVYHRKSGSTNTMSHTGVYLGDGTVADARGHDYAQGGVVHKDVASYPWTHYAIPVEVAREADLDTSEHPTYGEMRLPTIRKGANGAAVTQAQKLLNTWDESLHLELDGVFGSATEAAVIKFQLAHDLTADGVVGPLTWAALQKIEADAEGGVENDSEDDSEGAIPDDAVLAGLVANIESAYATLGAAVQKLVEYVRTGTDSA